MAMRVMAKIPRAVMVLWALAGLLWFPVVASEEAAKPQVMFLETSGAKKLRPMECCAITSAATQNPNFEVVVYAKNASNLLHDADKCFRGGPNIRVQPFEFRDLFRDTPLQDWYEDVMLPIIAREEDPSVKHQHRCFTAMNLGNAGRAAALWKYGGFYYDLDMISIGTIEDLSPRGLGIQKGKPGSPSLSVNGAALLFRDPKDPFLTALMGDLVENFDNCKWGQQGPERITQSLEAYGCIDTGKRLEPQDDVCDGLTVHAQDVFYPFSFGKRSEEDFFRERADAESWAHFRDAHLIQTRAVHLWNHIWKASMERTSSDSTSFFGSLMRESCGNDWRDIGQGQK